MVKINRQTNINGVCTIKVDEKDVQVAILNAVIAVDGSVSISKTIQNMDAFKANEEEVKLDFEAFEQYVYDTAADIANEAKKE